MAVSLHSIRLFDHPIRQLVALFITWKALLLLIACCSPGFGYDTSTQLISTLPSTEAGESDLALRALRYVVSKLIRWDAIYFVQISNRGYAFEQEWAFGWGFTRFINLLAMGLQKIGLPRYDGLESVLAVMTAHFLHLLSVVLLFKLTHVVFPTCSMRFSFTAAALHIISPAGLFLSAPYAESSCALLSFAGNFLFAKSLAREAENTIGHDLLVVLSGICFGIATTFRSNGILNGLLLLEEAFRVLWESKASFRFASVRRLLATGLGGVIVGCGFVLPQYIAYSEYCLEDLSTIRPWCGNSIPSIYTFVQGHYWNSGLFKYWTTSNLPLFLIAAPMFGMLIKSGLWAFTLTPLPSEKNTGGTKPKVSPVLHSMAATQLLLTLLTLTSAHVQIISRISSAYPVWLWYGASLMEKGDVLASYVTRYMVMYAVIQGGLFASFLPPA